MYLSGSNISLAPGWLPGANYLDCSPLYAACLWVVTGFTDLG
jgi:hypothetical protein